MEAQLSQKKKKSHLKEDRTFVYSPVPSRSGSLTEACVTPALNQHPSSLIISCYPK